MKHEDALEIAYCLIEKLAPHCERIEIAGSVRRGKPEVKDIEIVAVPKTLYVIDMWGNVADEMPAINDILMMGTFGRVVKAGNRYMQIELPEGINLDFFMVYKPAQWGVIFTIRTGPADFSKWCVTPRKYGGALPSDCRVEHGAVIRGGQVIPMPEESDFLEFLGLGWIEPKDRQAGMRARA